MLYLTNIETTLRQDADSGNQDDEPGPDDIYSKIPTFEELDRFFSSTGMLVSLSDSQIYQFDIEDVAGKGYLANLENDIDTFYYDFSIEEYNDGLKVFIDTLVRHYIFDEQSTFTSNGSEEQESYQKTPTVFFYKGDNKTSTGNPDMGESFVKQSKIAAMARNNMHQTGVNESKSASLESRLPKFKLKHIPKSLERIISKLSQRQYSMNPKNSRN